MKGVDNMPGGMKSIQARTGNLSQAEKDELEKKENEIREAIGNITPPGWLSDELKKRFIELAEAMATLNVLTYLDSNILADYVYYEKRFIDLDKEIARTGFTLSDGKANPLLNEQRQVRGLLDRMEMKLGFNPVDRLRFAKPEAPQPVDELEAFNSEL